MALSFLFYKQFFAFKTHCIVRSTKLKGDFTMTIILIGALCALALAGIMTVLWVKEAQEAYKTIGEKIRLERRLYRAQEEIDRLNAELLSKEGA